MAKLIADLDDQNFQTTIEQGTTLVDFFAEWCGPCRMMTPILEALAEELNGQVKFAKLDIDQAQQTTASFNVTSVPTLILFHGGKEVQRFVGLRDANTLKEMILKASA
ncbi:MAG: trxA-C [Chlamydiales bacterium]|jgi:thioredoxin 1|nr:trxA-C [Chlamydiales bacterium]